MILVYRVAYLFVKSLSKIFSFFLPGHLQAWLKLRQVNLTAYNRVSTPSIWFHASSGEVEYVKNIIFEIRKKNPNQKIVLTYSSPSLERLLFNIKDSLDMVIPLPWDQPTPLQKLIEIINPRTLIFAKTDFWPELIWQAKKQNLSIGVVAFSLYEKPKPTWIQSWCLEKMNFIFSADPHTFSVLTSFNFSVHESSDTRFDQVFFRLSQPTRFKLQFIKPLFVLGSTWPEDNAVLVDAVDEIITMGYQVVWCPHDTNPSALAEMQSLLKAKNFVSYSQINFAQAINNDILLVDQVGLLADIYRQSEIAFIGGSFRSKIHSVMEALCAGNIVCFGPYYKNNLEAVEFLREQLCFQFNSANQLLDWLNSLTPKLKSEKQQKIQQLAANKKGPSKKIAELLLT